MVFEAAPLSPDGINAPPPHPLASADHLPTSAVSSSGCHLLPLLRISTTWTRISGVRILRLLCPFRLGTWLISVSSAWIIRRITFSRSVILWCHRNIWRLDHVPPQEVCKYEVSISFVTGKVFVPHQPNSLPSSSPFLLLFLPLSFSSLHYSMNSPSTCVVFGSALLQFH